MITLHDIYKAVTDSKTLFNDHFKDEIPCPIGKSVQLATTSITKKAEIQMLLVLEEKTLKDLLDDIENKIH